MARRTSRNSIDIAHQVQLRYWAEELGVDPEVVKHAVEVMGPAVEDVRQYVMAYLSGTRRPARRHPLSFKRQ